MSARIGGLCSGYGGLEMAAQSVLGGSLAWAADTDSGASRVLAHHHPGIPNLGDITTVDWTTVPQVDILTAGFPCQDISNAGHRAGIEGARSGIWTHVVAAARVLRPGVLFLENVSALVTRGLDRVAADLAEIGFDAEWTCLRASDVGAPHRRERIFILAWPADAAGPGLEAGREGRPGGGADADAAHLGHQRTGGARVGWPGSAHGGHPVAHAQGVGRREGRTQPAGLGGGLDVALGGGPDWGPYEPAITRWERVTGRPAPVPTEPGRTGHPRLNPQFVEWLMGLPAGHVTDPAIGLTRTQQLRALGNGVVPAQGAAAIRLLIDRVAADHLHSLTS